MSREPSQPLLMALTFLFPVGCRRNISTPQRIKTTIPKAICAAVKHIRVKTRLAQTAKSGKLYRNTHSGGDTPWIIQP
ncbi:MAG TPA: hypothetical protein PLJ24_00625, partial [Anaerolineae bacterium]|nr:hypothetical protein [Anaerolineae bacterium]